MSQLVKNLKMMPTSEILFSVYKDDMFLEDSRASKILKDRLEKKYKLSPFRSMEIIKGDKKVFKRRGEREEDYAFMPGHTLSDTLNIIYKNLLPIDYGFDIYKRFSHLAFSELAMLPVLFDKLEHQYQMRLELAQNSVGVSREDCSLEVQMVDYFRFLKETSCEYLLLQADYGLGILKPSKQAVSKVMKVCNCEYEKIVRRDVFLADDLAGVALNPNSAVIDRRLIKKYPNSERIFMRRNGGQ